MQAPELRLVRYWVAVAEERNVTRAAARLHMSQPALSAAIKQLEGQLGVSLLDRSDRVLGVTPAGELLLAEGGALLREADRAVRAGAGAAGGERRARAGGDALSAGGRVGRAAARRAQRAPGPRRAVLRGRGAGRRGRRGAVEGAGRRAPARRSSAGLA